MPQNLIQHKSATADPDANVMEALEVAHALTRFHRALMGRRARQIARHIQTKAYVAEAVALRSIEATDEIIELPSTPLPEVPLASVLRHRRSPNRQALSGNVGLEEVSALLEMAVRSTGSKTSSISDDLIYNLRPYPSAGALYPCEVYVLSPGQPPLRYDARHHVLLDYGEAPVEFKDVETAAIEISPPCAVVITAVINRTTSKYGGRGYRFCLLESGQIGQNLLLAAEALGLPALAYGAFFDAELERALGVDGLTEVVTSVVLVGGRPQAVRGAPE